MHTPRTYSNDSHAKWENTIYFLHEQSQYRQESQAKWWESVTCFQQKESQYRQESWVCVQNQSAPGRTGQELSTAC